MSITKLLGYTAEAVILGMLKQIEYNENTGLLIRNLTLEDAHRILEALKTQSIVAIRPEVILNAPDKSSSKSTPKVESKVEPSKLEPKIESPSKAESPKAEPPSPPSSSKEPKIETTPKVELSTEAPTEGISGDILKATKLRDVIAVLLERGIKAQEAIIAECERLKPDVPLLSRIGNMSDRVARTLAVMQEKGE